MTKVPAAVSPCAGGVGRPTGESAGPLSCSGGGRGRMGSTAASLVPILRARRRDDAANGNFPPALVMGPSPPRGATMRGRGPGGGGVPGLVGRAAARADHHGVADHVGPGCPRDQREGALTAEQLDAAEAEEERSAPGIVGLATKSRPSRRSGRRHDTKPLGDHLVHGCRTPPLDAKADRPEPLVESPPRQADEVGPRPLRGMSGRGPTRRDCHEFVAPWCPQLTTAHPSVRQGLPWTGPEPCHDAAHRRHPAGQGVSPFWAS